MTLLSRTHNVPDVTLLLATCPLKRGCRRHVIEQTKKKWAEWWRRRSRCNETTNETNNTHADTQILLDIVRNTSKPNECHSWGTKNKNSTRTEIWRKTFNLKREKTCMQKDRVTFSHFPSFVSSMQIFSNEEQCDIFYDIEPSVLLHRSIDSSTPTIHTIKTPLGVVAVGHTFFWFTTQLSSTPLKPPNHVQGGGKAPHKRWEKSPTHRGGIWK